MKEDEWIKIEEKLPRQGKKVLVKWKDHTNKIHVDTETKWIYQGDWHFKYYDVDGANDLDDSQVTHWQPLP